MAGYNNYFPTGYQPYYPQYPQAMPAPAAQQVPANPPAPAPQSPGPNGGMILWVSGEEDAANYLVAPNSAVALWDMNKPVLYLKQADASGKPTTKVYDLVEHKDGPERIEAKPDFATKDEIKRLQEEIDTLKRRFNKNTARKENNE